MHLVMMHKGNHMQLNSDLVSKEIAPLGYWGRPQINQPITLGRLHLLPSSNRVKIDGVQIFLRPMEFRLLHFFMTNPDEVHTRKQLLEKIWGSWIIVNSRTVDVHIRRLRVTLQPFGLDRWVQTVHCRGYLFSPDSTKDTFIN